MERVFCWRVASWIAVIMTTATAGSIAWRRSSTATPLRPSSLTSSKDHVRTVFRSSHQGVRAVQRCVHGIAFSREVVRDQLDDLGIIVDDQDSPMVSSSHHVLSALGGRSEHCPYLVTKFLDAERLLEEWLDALWR